jgi:hypothetical protein
VQRRGGNTDGGRLPGRSAAPARFFSEAADCATGSTTTATGADFWGSAAESPNFVRTRLRQRLDDDGDTMSTGRPSTPHHAWWTDRGHALPQGCGFGFELIW